MLIVLNRCFLDSDAIDSMTLDSSNKVIKIDYLKYKSNETFEFNLHFENSDDARKVFYKIVTGKNRDCEYMVLDNIPVTYDKDVFKKIVMDELARGIEGFKDNLEELRDYLMEDKKK